MSTRLAEDPRPPSEGSAARRPGSRRPLTLLVLLLLPLVTAQSAGPVLKPLSSVLRLNPTTEGDQVHPAVGGLPDGRVVVVWEHEWPGGACQTIVGQERTDHGASPSGGEVVFSNPSVCDGVPDSVWPQVAMLRQGAHALVAWTNDSSDAEWAQPDFEAQHRRYAIAEDGFLGPVSSVHRGEPGELFGRVVPAYEQPTGGHVTCWNNSAIGPGGPVWSLCCQGFLDDGQADGAPFCVPDSGQGWVSAAPPGLVAAFAARDLDLSWTGLTTRTDWEGTATAAPQELDGSIQTGETLRVAGNDAGRALVVWVEPGEAASVVRAQLFEVDGTAAGAAFAVSDDATAHPANPAVGTNGGQFVVAWDDGGDPSRVRARAVTGDGVPLGPAIVVDPGDDTEGSTHQRHPSVTGTDDETFFVVWQGRLPGLDQPPNLDILGRVLTLEEGGGPSCG